MAVLVKIVGPVTDLGQLQTGINVFLASLAPKVLVKGVDVRAGGRGVNDNLPLYFATVLYEE